jgi:hypothetical protein
MKTRKEEPITSPLVIPWSRAAEARDCTTFTALWVIQLLRDSFRTFLAEVSSVGEHPWHIRHDRLVLSYRWSERSPACDDTEVPVLVLGLGPVWYTPPASSNVVVHSHIGGLADYAHYFVGAAGCLGARRRRSLLPEPIMGLLFPPCQIARRTCAGHPNEIHILPRQKDQPQREFRFPAEYRGAFLQQLALTPTPVLHGTY